MTISVMSGHRLDTMAQLAAAFVSLPFRRFPVALCAQWRVAARRMFATILAKRPETSHNAVSGS
jgi:hypothetical protein